MNFNMLRIILVSLFLSVSAVANAGLIEYIYTGTGSGSIGGQEFSDTDFTIIEYSDTDDLLSCGGACIYIDALTTTISLDGFGIFNFISGTRTFSNGGAVGFSRAGELGGDLYSSFNIANYGLTSNLGPIAGTPYLMQWEGDDIVTSAGILSFYSGSNNGTFEARIAAVPEPSTFAIFVFAFMGLAYRQLRN